MSYLLVSPCRNEADLMRITLDSVVNQSIKPALWVIVDDGSTDDTPVILTEYAEKYPFIQVISKENRGHRSVGPGVIEAFYHGYDQVDTSQFDYICKLDLDLDLPPRYFEILLERMAQNPRIGTCSGKAYFRDKKTGELISEKCGDEMSVGMTKFYRRRCFEEIGGFVRQVMWDGIDCHRCRQLGWIAVSWDEPELRFIHLRPIGASQKGILTGRMRHGFGQYFMGTGLLYMTASSIFRLFHPPYIIGGSAMWWGYIKSMLQRKPRFDDKSLVSFIRHYQRQCLLKGKARATTELNEMQAQLWMNTH
ncbi:glycosyltransferase family 2 protein [Methylophaga sp. OBS4]|uniref:glycosyltransferase family 2 protein n=1 Tax=Methylophaga sp. OBS4 TaxID=2991935 RepID=UPI00224F5B35|nr:glycosyltransferase family A protein [Methylophaga sp. OBS4]MCX4188423.1 glycosyltransferase family 2 protein [Methylophaga sp. OBS4]